MEHEVTTLDQVGKFADVNHKNLAFGPKASRSCKVFVRQETVDLWARLETLTPGNHLKVSGPPGTGKSTEVWQWGQYKAKSDKKTVGWFHLSTVAKKHLVIKGDNVTTFTLVNISLAIMDFAGDLLIVDGVTKDDSKDITQACTTWASMDATNRSFVTVSSISTGGAREHLTDESIGKHVVPSWVLEQYQKACENDEFFNTVKKQLECLPRFENIDDKDELIIAKYYFAGGCARWMFEFDYKGWKDDFHEHLRKVNGYENVFDNLEGEKSPLAVNHLRGVTLVDGEEIFFFVSQYTAVALHMKCQRDGKRKFLVDGYKKAKETKNPPFRGWIFEFDVDYQLTEAKSKGTSIVVQQEVEGKEQNKDWAVSKYITFKDVQEVAAGVKDLKLGEVLWAKPDKWNQKAYDFLRFWKKKKRENDEAKLYMAAVNAAWADIHSLKLEEVKMLGEKLGKAEAVVEGIGFEFVTPQDQEGEFAVGAVTGRLREWRGAECDDPWPNSDVAAKLMEDGKYVVVVKLARTKE
jgi:hypothetical protein